MKLLRRKYRGSKGEIAYGEYYFIGEIKNYWSTTRFKLAIWVMGSSSHLADGCWHCGMLNYPFNQEENLKLRLEYGRVKNSIEVKKFEKYGK